MLGGLGLESDHLLQSFALWRQPHEAGATVGGVGFAHEVAEVLEVTDQLVHRLLGDLHPLGDVGQAITVESGVANRLTCAAVTSS